MTPLTIRVKISTLFLAHALAVGSQEHSDKRNAVELLDLTTWTWETKSSYPFESQISGAPSLYVNQRFMLFGGQTGHTFLSRIAAYDPRKDEWTTEGHLLSPRALHGVINVADNSFIIMGGYNDFNDQQSSEKCQYNGDQLECSYQNPTEPYCKYKQ